MLISNRHRFVLLGLLGIFTAGIFFACSSAKIKDAKIKAEMESQEYSEPHRSVSAVDETKVSEKSMDFGCSFSRICTSPKTLKLRAATS